MKDDVQDALESIWQRIETQFRIEASLAHIPASEALADFQPGATEEEIRATEAALGVVFPDDVKASYLIHNGRMKIGDSDQRLKTLLSLEEVRTIWGWMQKYADGHKERTPEDWLYGDGQPILVRLESWNLNWIPLLDSNGDFACLDLAPSPRGQWGQIIDSVPENGTEHKWLAPSWQAFLSRFADDLEAGEYVFEDGHLIWS